jgi:hypothetical protein
LDKKGDLTELKCARLESGVGLVARVSAILTVAENLASKPEKLRTRLESDGNGLDPFGGQYFCLPPMNLEEVKKAERYAEVIEAPQWLKDRMEAVKKQPAPTLEQVKIQVEASMNWRVNNSWTPKNEDTKSGCN